MMNNWLAGARGQSVAPAIAAALALACCASGRLLAQQAADANPPSDRTVPGFVLFDSAMMSIEHVDPAHKNTLTIFSSLRNRDLLPRDIAVEILPWLPTAQTTDTVERQFERVETAAPRHYFGFSIAISQDVVPRGEVESLSQVAFGARTFLYTGRLNSALTTLLKTYRETTLRQKAAELKFEQRRQAGAAVNEESDEVTMLLLQSRSLLQQLATAPKNRVGFLAEWGATIGLRIPERRFSESRVARGSTWFTPIYRFDNKSQADVAGTIRIINEPDTSSQILDYGGRAGMRANDVYYSLEALGRYRFSDVPDPEDDHKYGRFTGGITYPLSRTTHISFTFGKNFAYDFSNGGSLLASVGLTIGRGQMALGTINDAN